MNMHVRDRVLEYFARHPRSWASVNQVCHEIRIPYRSVAPVVRELGRTGALLKRERGRDPHLWRAG